MPERWFTDASSSSSRGRRWTRDRGATTATRQHARLQEMKHEWLMLHDLMAESVLG